MARDPRQPLRLPKRHDPTAATAATAEDGGRLMAGQSLKAALLAALIALVVFSVLWIMVTRLTGRILPWMTIIQGIGLGYAVRRAGNGIDWRFPALAALLAGFGAFFSYAVVAASVTAESMGTGTLHILRSVTAMTWPVFFAEVVTAADYVFAASAAIAAAFFAARRLSRSEYRAVRLWRERRAADR
ncbi:MAG: hypothetical protein WBN09_02290 [Woeseiaceae bacterium]